MARLKCSIASAGLPCRVKTSPKLFRARTELGLMARAWVHSLSESCQTWAWFQVRTPNPTTTHVAMPARGKVVCIPVFHLAEVRQQDNKPAPAKIAQPRFER